MKNHEESGDLVTDRPKVTGCDGLYEFNWKNVFHGAYMQTSVTIRHPSLNEAEFDFRPPGLFWRCDWIAPTRATLPTYRLYLAEKISKESS